MSSGMVAKVKLALTFARDSKLIMLDEPLNGIDIIARERTLALDRQQHTSERALIVSSHLVDELEEMIDDAVFMLNGAAALAGSAQRIREQYGVGIVEMYRRIYGEGGVQVMLKLVKYELRKNRTALLVLLAVIAAIEAYFLISIMRESDADVIVSLSLWRWRWPPSSPCSSSAYPLTRES